MLQSLRVSESGLIGQQKKLEIIANNLANTDTPGFKRILTTFAAEPPAVGGNLPAGGGNPGVQPQARAGAPGNQNILYPGSLLRLTTAPDLSSGSMRATDNPLDLAVNGEGLFVVQRDGQEFYTRNGSFQLNAEGRLITRDGSTVMGEGGAIEIPPGAIVEFSSDGLVRANGTDVGRIKLVVPNQATDLLLEGNAQMRRAPGAPALQTLPTENTRVMSGFLETSNTNPVSELVSMITAQRIFEAGQRVLTSADETLKKAVTELPRVSG